jgi:hypothetical protein
MSMKQLLGSKDFAEHVKIMEQPIRGEIVFALAASSAAEAMQVALDATFCGLDVAQLQAQQVLFISTAHASITHSMTLCTCSILC